MFASNKALNQQKRHNLHTGFCGGFTRGPVGLTAVYTYVGVASCQVDPGDRDLGLTCRIRSIAVWTPTCA